jgi:hypothetical protein
VGQGFFAASYAKTRQEVQKLNPGRIDGVYGILCSDSFFVGADIGDNFRINTFKDGVNYVSELFRGFEVISPSVANASDYKSCQTSNNQLVRDGNGEDRVDKFFQFWIPIWMMGLILGVLLAR